MKEDLERQGFEVSRRSFWWNPLFSFKGTGLFNPTNAYGQVIYDSDFPKPLPALMDQAHPDGQPKPPSTLLGSLDGTLFVGCAPPSGSYYAWDMDVAYRFNTGAPYYPSINFGDAANQLSMMADDDDDEKPFSWGDSLTVLQAFDRSTADAVEAALARAGQKPAKLHALSGEEVRLWDSHAPLLPSSSSSDELPDVFTTLVRWSVDPADVSSPEVQSYLSQKWPVLVLRKDGGPLVPLSPSLRPRGVPSLPSESTLVGSSLSALSSSASQAVLLAAPSLTSVYGATLRADAPAYYDDWVAVLSNSSYAGEGIFPTRDALYGNPGDDHYDMSLSGVGVIVGVNHETLGRSTWNNLGFNFLPTVGGGGNNDTATSSPSSVFVIDEDLKGSAIPFLSEAEDAANAQHLSCLFVVGPTSPLKCGDLPSGALCVELTADANWQGGLKVRVEGGERVYLDPRTRTGPQKEDIEMGRWMVFDVLL